MSVQKANETEINELDMYNEKSFISNHVKLFLFSASSTEF